MPKGILSAVLTSLGLATAIHVDWHIARPAHHRLSLGLSWHWVLATPVFALVAWYVAKRWPNAVGRASVAILGSAILAAGVVEPAWEYYLEDAPFEWAFGASRNAVLFAFVATGLLAYIVTLIVMRRRRGSPIAGSQL